MKSHALCCVHAVSLPRKPYLDSPLRESKTHRNTHSALRSPCSTGLQHNSSACTITNFALAMTNFSPLVLSATLIVSRAGMAVGCLPPLILCPTGKRCAYIFPSYQCIGEKDGTENNICAVGRTCFDGTRCQTSTTICKRPEVIALEECLASTRTVMVAIKSDYQTAGVTIRSAKVGETLMVLDDFLTNAADNRAYEYACTDKGATYVELHYNATCEASAVGGDSKKSAIIFIAGQPRCYSKICNQQAFEQGLLNSFSLRQTEERADLDSHSKQNWTCTGTLRQPSSTLCRDMSTSINMTRAMEIASLGIKPVIQVQKSLGLVKEEKLLSFAGHDPAKFTRSCELAGGAAFEADGRLVCGESKFDVKKYPVCLWPLCGGVRTDESEAFMESRLHEQLVNFGHIKNKTACNFSSAVRLYASACSIVFSAILSATIGTMLL